MGFRLVGKTQRLDVRDDGETLRLVVPLAGLETGIGLRDRHMHEKYLETQRFPEVVLELPWSSVKLPKDGESLEASARGKLTLHGKTREVDFTYELRRTGSSYQVNGRLPIRITDFGIHVPSYLGVTVHPDILASVSFSASRT